MTVRALADAGHTVYAGMRGTTGRNETAAADAARYATEHSVDLRRSRPPRSPVRSATRRVPSASERQQPTESSGPSPTRGPRP